MRRRLLLSLLVACAPPAPALDGSEEERSCGRLVLSAVPPPGRRVDLVLAVNGEVCRREPLVRAWRGRVTRLCGPEAFEPGANRVELQVDPPGCAPPLARSAVRCRLPEPD